MEEIKPIFSIPIGSFHINITLSLIVQWIIMIIVGVLLLWLASNLKKVPGKKQTVAEMFYKTIKGVVTSNMGNSYESYVPIFGTLAVFLLLMNFTGLIGITPPTKDYSVCLGLALCSFLMIHANAIKKMGFGHYLLGYGKPFIPMLPINIMERAVFPATLSLRLFGNVLAGTVILDLIYKNMGHFAVGVPIIGHLYFDLFDGGIQMVVFLMLTMINIKLLPEH